MLLNLLSYYICPTAIAYHRTLGQVIKSLASVCQSVCRRSYGYNFYSIFKKFCTEVRGLESKIEFVCDENPMDPFPYFALIFLPM